MSMQPINHRFSGCLTVGTETGRTRDLADAEALESLKNSEQIAPFDKE